MAITVRQIAEWISAEVVGDPDLPIEQAQPLSDAGEGDLSFLDHKHRTVPVGCRAAAFVVGPDFQADGVTVIRTDDPLLDFAEIVRRFRYPDDDSGGGIDPTARVHPSARVAEDAFIDAFTIVGPDCEIGSGCRISSNVRLGRGVRLGAEVRLRANVVINDHCVLGDRVSVFPNVVIGSDGFGYRLRKGKHQQVPQLGHVEIGDDVEIGACSTIDRGTFGATRIGAGTKIDNHVQIAHNCQIGRHNLIAAHVGLAGSVTTGDHAMLGGQVGVADQLSIGEGSIVAAQAGVMRDIPAGETYWGTPALPMRQVIRMHVCMEKLTKIWHRLGALLDRSSRPGESEAA